MIPTSAKQSRAASADPAPGRQASRQRPWLGNRPYLTGGGEKGYTVTVFEGGTLLHLEGFTFDSKITYEEGRQRGRIGDFSSKSRQRMMRAMFSVNLEEAGLPVLVGLTYQGEYPKEPKKWKRDLDAFFKALRRKYPNVWGVWRLEFQDRGAPEVHLLLWDGPTVDSLEVIKNGKVIRVADRFSERNKPVYDWFADTWFRIVGSGDEKHRQAGTRIEPIRSRNGVLHYVAKYLAKMPDGKFTPVNYPGRFWGRIQGEKWKVTETKIDLGPEAFKRYKRVLVKLRKRKAKEARKRAKDKGWEVPAWAKRGQKGDRNGQGMYWYMDSVTALRLAAWAVSTPAPLESRKAKNPYRRW